MLDHVLIDGVNEVEDLESALSEAFKEGGGSDRGTGLTSDVVDRLLAFLHAGDVVLEGDLVLTRLACVEAEEFGELHAVSSVFMNSKLEVLGKLLVELFVVFGIFLNLGEHLKALFDNVLLHDLEDFVLLKCLTRDVEG